MPIRRMINPEIWFNEKFAKLTDSARLLFIGIFSNADDEGRIKASPQYLKAHIFPYDDKELSDIKQLRDQCAKVKLVKVYRLHNIDYIELPGWYEHQLIRKDRFKQSVLPSPKDNGSQPTTIRQPSDNHPTTTGKPSLSQSSLIQSNTIQSNTDFRNVIDNEKDLTDRLTDFLTLNLSAPGGAQAVMDSLKNKLWPQAGSTMSTGVFDVIYEALRKHPPGVMAVIIAKAVKYSDGKKKPASYVTKIIDEQTSKAEVEKD